MAKIQFPANISVITITIATYSATCQMIIFNFFAIGKTA
jgi:hypothetical protein